MAERALTLLRTPRTVHEEVISSVLLHDERVEHMVRCTVGPFWVAMLGLLARPFYIRDAVVALTNRRLIVSYVNGKFDALRLDRAKTRSAPRALVCRTRFRRLRASFACTVRWPNGTTTPLAFRRRYAEAGATVLAAIAADA